MAVKKYKRPDWDEYFLGIKDSVAKRATCDRGRTACVIVKDKRILATGYAGSPMGIAHCDDIGHEMAAVTDEEGRTSQHCVRTAHAEMNAIALAARVGAALEGSTMYMKMAPCYTCAKVIINAGVVRVVAEVDYHASRRSKEIFKEAGIKLDILHNKVEQYAKQ